MMNVACRNSSPSWKRHNISSLSHIEQALLRRRLRPPTTRSSWERETGRGIQHVFGEYRLKLCAVDGKSTTEVVIQEDCSSIATRVWDCAVATTKWLEKAALMHTEQDVPWNLRGALQLSAAAVDNRPLQVLELGSGTGLLSIALAKMGAAVMSTEYGTAVAHLRRNCEVNNVEVGATSSTTLTAGRVCCRELDWYKTIETLQSLFQKPNDIAIFDLIAITDCSLSVKESMGVLNMIDKYGTHGHTRVLVGLCNEREGTSHFINASSQKYSKENMRVISSSEYHEDFPTTRHTILLIQL